MTLLQATAEAVTNTKLLDWVWGAFGTVLLLALSIAIKVIRDNTIMIRDVKELLSIKSQKIDDFEQENKKDHDILTKRIDVHDKQILKHSEEILKLKIKSDMQ